MKQRWQNATPEQRERMKRRWQEKQERAPG
jgi:hypothetical protein